MLCRFWLPRPHRPHAIRRTPCPGLCHCGPGPVDLSPILEGVRYVRGSRKVCWPPFSEGRRTRDRPQLGALYRHGPPQFAVRWTRIDLQRGRHAGHEPATGRAWFRCAGRPVDLGTLGWASTIADLQLGILLGYLAGARLCADRRGADRVGRMRLGRVGALRRRDHLGVFDHTLQLAPKIGSVGASFPPIWGCAC